MRDRDRGLNRVLIAVIVGLLVGAGCERSTSSATSNAEDAAAERTPPGADDPALNHRAANPSAATLQSDIKRTSELASKGKGDNILFVSVDTTRADCIGCYGNKIVRTPNIDRLAREGVRFAMCVSSAPLTFPSHSTMMTGSYPFIHGARDNGIYMLSDANKTLAELFKEQGYATHAEVAAAVLDPKYNLRQGFDTYGAPDQMRPASPPGYEDSDSPEPRVSNQDLLEATVELERKADEITRYGIDLIKKSVDADQRFFIWLHYFDPHWPHEPPARFAVQYPRDMYFAEIAYFDEQFGRLINLLRELGVAEDTFVVLISDHGEGRGQHSEYTHSSFLYDTTLHVPLIMWAPSRLPTNVVIESQVRSVDVAPTILDFVGLDPTPQMQGTSLLPLIENPSMPIQLAAYSDTIVPRNMHDYSHLRSLRTDDWKFILAPKPELYNVSEDPLELFNRFAADSDRASEMREELRDLIANSPPAPGGRANRQQADEDAASKLAALGYVAVTGSPQEDEMTVGTELDHFEPQGRNPRDHVEEIDCFATGLGSYRVGKYDTAEIMFKRLVELDPSSIAGWAMLGTTYMVQDRPEEALRVFQKALELDKNDATTLRHIGVIHFVRGDYDEADKFVRKAMSVAPDEWQNCLVMGRIHMARNELVEAQEILQRADELSPKNAEVKLRQGILNLLGRRPRAAKELLTESLRYRPDFVPAIFNLARCHIALDEFDAAAAGFARVAELSPEHAPAYALGAAAFHALGENRKMIKLLETGYKNVPEDPKLGNDLAWWLATLPDDELRDGARAIEIAEKAAAAAGMEHFNELDTLAAAYAEAGKFDKAVTTAKRALKLATESGASGAKQDIGKRLALYERNQPYRSE